ncbi:hypothetical protein ACLOJK_014622 [Asimina triloba]
MVEERRRLPWVLMDRLNGARRWVLDREAVVELGSNGFLSVDGEEDEAEHAVDACQISACRTSLLDLLDSMEEPF